MGRPCAFLDRDGVLNRDLGFVYRPEEFQVIPGAIEAVKVLNEMKYLVIVVTNQSGIARGMFSEDEFHTMNRWMIELFSSRGARIDDVFYCPHHPEHGIAPYRMPCQCRKPKPGMLLEAMRKWGIELRCSFLVGNNATDLEAAQAAGVTGFLYHGHVPLHEFLLDVLKYLP